MKTEATILELIAENERLKVELKETQDFLGELLIERSTAFGKWADGLARLVRIMGALRTIEDEQVQAKISAAWVAVEPSVG